MIILQLDIEYIARILHVKSEDLRLCNLSDEKNPVHLDDETMTSANFKFQKLLVESEYTCSTIYVLFTTLEMQGGGNYLYHVVYAKIFVSSIMRCTI